MFDERIFRCGHSDYYGDEILAANRTHTPQRLAEIARSGFNGIWLRGILRNLAPTDLFRKYVRKSDQRLEELKKLCRRGRRLGLGVWLYMTEPLGLPVGHRFWRDHRGLAGLRSRLLDEAPEYALCSSSHEVRGYLRDGFCELFGRVDLAGVILITASEHASNCWAHLPTNPNNTGYSEFRGQGRACRRCGPRGPEEVIAEIVNTIHTAVKSARADAQVVAWDWSWNMHLDPPYAALTDRLGEEVILMGDFERGGVVSRSGRRLEVEEYSLIYSGPSKRFGGEVKVNAQKRRMWAKLQINTTHELATVANLPLVVSLYRKFSYMRRSGVRGYMACWNFACAPDTLNVFAVGKLSGSRLDGCERRWLGGLARDYFGRGVDAEGVVRAWYGFMRACYCYPIGGGNEFLYWGPLNYALAYPLKLHFDGKAMGPSWLKHSFGDRLEDSATSYSLPEIAELLGKLTARWAGAVRVYEVALARADRRCRASMELGTAGVAGAAFRSAWNVYRWYLLRRRRRSEKVTRPQREIIADELANLEAALPLVAADRRLGFHQEAQWGMFSPAAIRKKRSQLRELLGRND
jgi:hypothetical protein